MRRIAIAILAILGVCIASQADAREPLPHPCTIPANLVPFLPKALHDRCERLDRERTALSNQIGAFESQCNRKIVEGSPEHRTCAALDRAVDANIKGYLRDVRSIQANLRKEIAGVQARQAARIPDKPVIKRDVIDPRWLAMPGEAKQAERIRVRLDALAVQKAFFEKERDKLRAIQGGTQQLWLNNVTAQRTLLQDAQSQTLDVLDGLLTVAQLPPKIGIPAGAALSAIQAYFYHYAYVNAQDEQRAREKMIEAVGAFKNIVASVPLVSKGKEAEAVKAATDGVLKIYKILDRQRRSSNNRMTRANWDEVRGALIDITQAVTPVLGGKLKVANAAPSLAFVPFAVGAMEWDRAEIEKAYESNRTALSYYDDRLAQIAQKEALYRESLRLAPPNQ